MAIYGATFDIERPEKHDRTQLAIRLLILIVLAILAGSLGWIHFGLYLALPVLGAILISQKGVKRYHEEAGESVTLWLRYAAAFYAYAWLLTDRLPNEDPRETLRFEIVPSGEPTAGGVLLRIITAIPHAIVLAILGVFAFILAVVAAISILATEAYPESIFNFLRGFVRWQMRLLAYLAGLVDAYPPFSFDTGAEPMLQLPPGDGSQTQAT